MSDNNLPPLPGPEAWRTHVGPWDCSTAYAYTVNQMRAYAAQAVAAEREACIRIIEDTVRAVDGMDAIAAIRARGQERDALRADAEKHYAAGWIAAAKWAERDDLISDIDSPAYIADRDAAIDRAKGQA